jgi:hypothetical protein
MHTRLRQRGQSNCTVLVVMTRLGKTKQKIKDMLGMTPLSMPAAIKLEMISLPNNKDLLVFMQYEETPFMHALLLLRELHFMQIERVPFRENNNRMALR